MILSDASIRQRIKDGEIIKKETAIEASIKEASYVLRVANDGLMVDDNRYAPGQPKKDGPIVIAPGRIAILSTVERLCMPGDLVGKIGIRFNYACQGLTGLMGIQVDPHYGFGHLSEPLYIRVANLGNYDITIPFNEPVFTFELHKTSERVPQPKVPRQPMWYRLQDVLGDHREWSWSYVTRVEANTAETTKRLDSEVKSIQDYLQPLVMFGIFLVAVTILGVALSVIFGLRDTPTSQVPTWFSVWGWAFLFFTIATATITTLVIGVATVVSICIHLLRRT